VFDKTGNFTTNGEELLIRKATGYVSFVRGENPYTFPYRVYPKEFEPNKTFPTIEYPDYQMNLKKIKYEDKERILDLYMNTIGGCKNTNCGKCQGCCYKYIIHYLTNKQTFHTNKLGKMRNMPDFKNLDKFNYTMLQIPVESLIISYPFKDLKDILDKIPADVLSDKFSPSLSETKDEEEENEDDEETKDEEENEDEEEEGSSSNSSSDGSSSDGSNENIKGGANKSLILNVKTDQLTGSNGLKRIMTFREETSPDYKGDFDYKPKLYGNIFTRDQIGTYSSKINSVLDNIYNTDEDTVAEGIILIYSQYIDGGLIPMALALEEMGFSRYNHNSLFNQTRNNKPALIDARTMKPPTDKNDFKPACYTMITGDGRLSPHNDEDVKEITINDNKDGIQVKVFLISKTGAEGIDFKFIRQVHILDPWYNMNRIEQIIGRAVRNFSHKDLPFEKRNVQIFMHGTILNEPNEPVKKEAADLYIYRLAEYKAVQIGKVTRVLKQSSVDCIINHNQTNFTQAIMTANLKINIVQTLSTGKEITNFKIGDAPFSPSCDYMATCDYKCSPDAKINEYELNEDTYDENFIIMNSEKILQRIRMLFKEAFFYKKINILKFIRIQKDYPQVQIFSALTQLIQDENEFIVDKYGRNGRLINIGEYYLFQPVELKYKNASIYDRSTPLDFKNEVGVFKINKNIEKQGMDEINMEEGETDFSAGKSVVDKMIENILICQEYENNPDTPIKDNNWFKYSGLVINKMKQDYPESSAYLIYFVVEHIIELLLFKDKMDLMNYIYSLEVYHVAKDDNIESIVKSFVKSYFDQQTINTTSGIAYMNYDLNKKPKKDKSKKDKSKEEDEYNKDIKTFFILSKENNKQWVEAEPLDIVEINKTIKKLNLTFNKTEYNSIIGFMGYTKGNKDILFKTKDLTEKRNTGAICSQAIKNVNLKKLNESIIGDKTKYNEKSFNNFELCVFMEIILRYFNKISHNNKKWFLTPEMAIYYNLYTIF
jgi:ribosomal protein L12E/L44/L45/RPP1/RPP2